MCAYLALSRISLDGLVRYVTVLISTNLLSGDTFHNVIYFHIIAYGTSKKAANVPCTFNHRRAVAQPCVNGDRLSQWKMAKFDPAQI